MYAIGSTTPIEGKTKKLFDIGDGLVRVVSKDDITAGDGAKHDVIPEKGRLATQTTCNVFRLLNECGIKTAFVAQDSDDSTFVARKCAMLPYEVVVRREAHGSFVKRNPHIEKGQLFPQLLLEFFLKTKDRDWKGRSLVCDDPLMRFDSPETIALLDPAKPIHGQEPFLVLQTGDVFSQTNERDLLPRMGDMAKRTFLVLERAWQLEGGRLVDFKVEFGIDTAGDLLLADVIDNDSWRVVQDGAYLDKQVYRDNGQLSEVAAKYARVAEITNQFRLPRQQIIIWRGSDSDKLDDFVNAAEPFKDLISTVVCSMHKQPVSASLQLHQILQEVPDSVVIAYVGRSNGAGPTLSAMSTVSVITVPANVKEFPDDVWSSLRMPSKVPVMTVLEPSNAVLAALNILSARNPKIYSVLRSDIESRLVNTATVR